MLVFIFSVVVSSTGRFILQIGIDRDIYLEEEYTDIIEMSANDGTFPTVTAEKTYFVRTSAAPTEIADSVFGLNQLR
jgi:hypothetical protein